MPCGTHTPCAGNSPPALTGRDAQLQQWEVLVRRLAAGRGDQSSSSPASVAWVLIVEAKSYAERLFAYPRLDRLDPDAARAALALPAQAEDVEFQEEALSRILELSGAYPAFLQAYGREAWNTAPRSPITLDDVRAAEPIVQRTLDEQFFHVRFEKATPAERRYMSAMAALGNGPQNTGEVAKKMSYRGRSSGSLHRDALIKKGLIYSPEHGAVDFTVPRFAAFMRRRYPFDG